MIKDLIADKKKVAEGCKKFIRNSMEEDSIFCGVEFIYYEDEIDDPDLTPHRATELCDKCNTKIDTLGKGISVATKLIEDELRFLDSIKANIIGRCYTITEDRIKYLKSLLDNGN